jgi:hypothetical protein
LVINTGQITIVEGIGLLGGHIHDLTQISPD